MLIRPLKGKEQPRIFSCRNVTWKKSVYLSIQSWVALLVDINSLSTTDKMNAL